MDEPKLKNPRLKLVAINYLGKCNGNAERSVIEAGYSKAYARGNAYKLVAREDVQKYIKFLREFDSDYLCIMELKKLQAFWTKIILDENQKIKDRLRASELLGRSIGAFKEEW